MDVDECCWEMFERCLRDVRVMLRDVWEMSERCFWNDSVRCLRIVGVMSLECCWGCWRLLRDVLVLSTVSQHSLKLLSHSHCLNSLSTTVFKHSLNTTAPSAISQQSLNSLSTNIVSCSYLSTVSPNSLSLSQSSLNTPETNPFPPRFPLHSSRIPTGHSVKLFFACNLHTLF